MKCMSISWAVCPRHYPALFTYPHFHIAFKLTFNVHFLISWHQFGNLATVHLLDLLLQPLSDQA